MNKWLHWLFQTETHKLAVLDKYRNSLTFHYIGYATSCDIVQVYLRPEDTNPYYTWNWISGRDAYPNSFLGKLHNLYETSKKPHSIHLALEEPNDR